MTSEPTQTGAGIPAFLTNARRYLFFTGKGGVGKTSLACASALYLADAGRRVLIVSTDPASNLDAVLATGLANRPTPIVDAPNLLGMNIDPEVAAAEYRERTVGPHRGVLPPEEVALLEERLSGACTVEVAAFDEFALLLGDPARTAAFDHVIFDTAPTGHTLRLLELPAAWTGFIDAGAGDTSCLGPLSGLKAQRDRYAETVKALATPSVTAMIIVARPDAGALAEAARTAAELREQGMTNQHLAVNGLFVASDPEDPLAVAFGQRAAAALAAMPEALRPLPRTDVLLRPHNIVGLGALRQMFAPVDSAAARGSNVLPLPAGVTGLSALIDAFDRSDHGLIMVMGKGGVGKTTVAAAVAVGLADRGRPVHLTTTDPAQNLDATLSGALPNLQVDFIDPAREVQRYREHALATAKATSSPEQLALLREELQSPCYEELAVFQAFARTVMSARKGFVVIDTAPTGHTLLLLDTTGAYHRQILQQSPMPSGGRIRTPLMLLQDRDYTKVVIVTLAETTPVLEAAGLQDDLRRAEIEPFAWVINASLAAAAPADPVLRARAAAEIAQFEAVVAGHADRVACIPFLAEEPVGVSRLRALNKADRPALARARA